MKLIPGMQAPKFVLPNQDGKYVYLSEVHATHTILYFYPKDSTPGCTLETKEFSALHSQFKKFHTEVFGISGLSVESKKKFCKKNNLKISLLADEDLKVSKAYGVHDDNGIARTTFLLDKDKQIIRIHRDVKPQGHAQQLLEDIKHIRS